VNGYEGELVRINLLEGAYGLASSLPRTLHDSEQGWELEYKQRGYSLILRVKGQAVPVLPNLLACLALKA
jgi:hypothetical protein